MNRANIASWVLGLLTILGLASLGTSQDPVLQDPIQIQTSGPLHEAFAQPIDAQGAPGPIVPKEPPPMIPEDPPEQKPAAENSQWHSGYWAWDAQKQEFLWVTGVHRVPPDGRTFVPGYWQRNTEGWRWIHGFWANANQPDVPYSPEPPASLEIGPSMPQPDDNSVYVPGNWIYRDTRFIWRGGYYSLVHVGRVWTPSRFIWTPNGWLYIDGFLDLPFEERGIVFAPVYFSRPLWRDAGWRYRPHFVLGIGGFFDSAFVCGGSFYFGNYYDPFYARNGYRPWYGGHGRYDPIFAHHGWQNHRNNRNWVGGVQQTYAARSGGRATAPRVAVTPLNQFTSTKVKLVATTPTQLQTQRSAAQQTRQLAVNRQQFDTTAASKGGNVRTTDSRSLRISTAGGPNSTASFSSPSSTKSTVTTPVTKIQTPSSGPKTTTTPVTKSQPTPSSGPKTTTTPVTGSQPTPSSGPKTTTTPRTTTTPPPPRTVTPPRTTTPPPPARPKKASLDVDPPKLVTKAGAAAPQRTVTAPTTAPRVQASALPVQPQQRVNASAPRVQPQTRVNGPPARPANNKK